MVCMCMMLGACSGKWWTSRLGKKVIIIIFTLRVDSKAASGEQGCVASMELDQESYTRQEVEQLIQAYRREWLLEACDVPAQNRVTRVMAGDDCLCDTRTSSLFKSVFDTVLDAILIIDDAGKIITVNPATCRMFGFEVQELVGNSINMIMTEEYRHHHDQFIRQYLQGKEPGIIGVSGREFPALRKDGSEFPMEIAITRAQMAARTYFIGVIHDISRRVQQEEELRQARDEALRSSRIKSDILSNFSHEIRTPMNGIIGCAELLSETPLDDEQKTYINVVIDSANGLLTLLNDLVDLSRLETGKIRTMPCHSSPGICSRAYAACFRARPRTRTWLYPVMSMRISLKYWWEMRDTCGNYW